MKTVKRVSYVIWTRGYVSPDQIVSMTMIAQMMNGVTKASVSPWFAEVMKTATVVVPV